MRKHAKSWLIKFLIAIIAIVFIFYFGYSFTSDRGAKVAEVNGEIISRLEYEKAYRDRLINLQNEYKNVWDDNLIKAFDLKNAVLEGLIEKKLVSQEARKIGLKITETEVQAKIADIPAFQSNGYFDERRYQALLSSNRMEPEDFEESFTQDLLQQKLIQFLMTFSAISDQDVLDYYRYANEKMKLGFIKFSPEDFKNSIKIEPALMKKYFEDNIEDYRVPVKIKLTYINIDPDTFIDNVKIEEPEINSYYEENIDMFTEEKNTKSLDEVRDQIINILARNESADLANEKALSLIDQMPYDVDLVQYAKQHDVPVADTDSFSKNEPIPLIAGNEKLLDTIFSFEKNDVSEIIELDNIFYIMQVSDKKESYLPELEEVSEHVREDCTQYLALLEAKSQAEKYLEALKGGSDWDELLKERNKKADTTNFFTRLEFPDKVGSAPGIQESAFKLSENNRYPDKVFENDKGAFVIRWEEKKEIDDSKYQDDKKRYSDAIMVQRQQTIFMSWIDRLKKNAEIDRSDFRRMYD